MKFDEIWQEHTRDEFETRDTGNALDAGVAPTHKHVEILWVAIARFRDGKLAHEFIYSHQASVLEQVGLISDESLPVFGMETARKGK